MWICGNVMEWSHVLSVYGGVACAQHILLFGYIVISTLRIATTPSTLRYRLQLWTLNYAYTTSVRGLRRVHSGISGMRVDKQFLFQLIPQLLLYLLGHVRFRLAHKLVLRT